MGTTAETGRAGERAAVEYLRGAGYEICALNWRSGRYELDIVARKAGIVHFVEVKTRRAGSLTPPEAAVTPQKFRALTRGGRALPGRNGRQEEAQFDLAAVDVMPDGAWRCAWWSGRWNTTGNFAFPTNYTTFVALKMKALRTGPEKPGPTRRKLTYSTSTPQTVNTDVVI